MYVSDEQRGAILWGERRVSWEVVELPTGRQALPTWARDLHVDFMDGYGNDPRYTLKAWGDLRSWPDKRFVREGARFMAVSPDGRAEVYYQDGQLRPAMLKRFRTTDGRLHAYRPQTGERVREYNAAGQMTLSHVPYDPGEWVEVERLCTPQQDGFGGAHIDITMEDGTEVTLRGPWHGGCPNGFVELAYADASRAGFARDAAWWRKTNRRQGVKDRPCWGTCTGGLFLREDVFIRLFARYQPHLRLMRLREGERALVQATKPEWDAPKCVILDRERRARKQAEWDAMRPEDRPPHPMCSWPKVCGGKADCSVAEFNRCTPKEST